MNTLTYRLAAVAVSLQTVLFFGNVPLVAAAEVASVQQPAVSQSFSPEAFLAYTNADRIGQGMAPLQLNDELNAAALAKAEDMADKEYWAHFRPSDGKTPWSFIDAAGYHYKVAGENLAKGYRTPAGITDAWMHSPEHRANLMSAKYSDVGFACIEAQMNGETVLLTVQMFGSR